jgi:hypothetical protein
MPSKSHSSPAWPLRYPVLATVLWSVAILVVFAAPAVRRDRRMAAA